MNWEPLAAPTLAAPAALGSTTTVPDEPPLPLLVSSPPPVVVSGGGGGTAVAEPAARLACLEIGRQPRAEADRPERGAAGCVQRAVVAVDALSADELAVVLVAYVGCSGRVWESGRGRGRGDRGDCHGHWGERVLVAGVVVSIMVDLDRSTYKPGGWRWRRIEPF